MVDPEFYKNDKDFYSEWIGMKGKDKSKMKEEWKELRRKALRLLNDDLHEKGHQGSIMGIDVSDDELWKYLDGEEKERFNKIARILDFEWGFKPNVGGEGIVIKPSNKSFVKKFKDIKNEAKMIKEGMRFNTTYISLPDGEYNIEDVLKELEELKNELMVWKRGGWQTVSAPDRENKEIIPLMK